MELEPFSKQDSLRWLLGWGIGGVSLLQVAGYIATTGRNTTYHLNAGRSLFADEYLTMGGMFAFEFVGSLFPLAAVSFLAFFPLRYLWRSLVQQSTAEQRAAWESRLAPWAHAAAVLWAWTVCTLSGLAVSDAVEEPGSISGWVLTALMCGTGVSVLGVVWLRRVTHGIAVHFAAIATSLQFVALAGLFGANGEGPSVPYVQLALENGSVVGGLIAEDARRVVVVTPDGTSRLVQADHVKEMSVHGCWDLAHQHPRSCGDEFDHQRADALVRQHVLFASQSEAAALRTLDIKPLGLIYADALLTSEIARVQDLAAQKVFEVSILVRQDIESVTFDQTGLQAQVRLTEVWKNSAHQQSDGSCIWQTKEHAVPQTMQLFRYPSGWKVFNVIFPESTPQADRLACAQ